MRGKWLSTHGWTSSQNDIDKHGHWAHKSLMGFNKEVVPLLHLGWDNPTHQYRLKGAPFWHHCGHNIEHKARKNEFLFHKANLLLNCIRKRVASRLKEVIILFYFHSGVVWRSWRRSSGRHYIRDLDHEGRGWRSRANVIWWEEGLRVLLIATYSYLKEVTKMIKWQMQQQSASATHCSLWHSDWILGKTSSQGVWCGTLT